MLRSYSGATRVVFIVGDPIAQVKSPLGVTQALRARGADAIVVPAQVRPADIEAFFTLARRMPNVAINATPLGMRPDDPLPLDAERLTPATFVGDVVTWPERPPLIEAARSLGCSTLTGAALFDAVRERMVDFLLCLKDIE